MTEEIHVVMIRQEMERNLALRNVLERIEKESKEENIRTIAHDGIRNNDANGDVIAGRLA
jgi:hypothetical protein